MKYETNITDIEGKIVSGITGAGPDSEELTISFTDGCSIRFFHNQWCCEDVRISDIVGDFSEFVGQPITGISERSESGDTDYGTETWTFYEFTCPKCSVTVRWLGESNGYYSESVDWEIKKEETK